MNNASYKLLANPKVLAISRGRELCIPQYAPKTLTQALLENIEKYPDKGIISIDEFGKKYFQTYQELLVQAKCILAGLEKQGCQQGDSIILYISRFHIHFAAFWGCILGGMRPVIINVAKNFHEKNLFLDKFYNVHKFLGKPKVIINLSMKDDFKNFTQLYSLNAVDICIVEELIKTPQMVSIYLPTSSEVMYYQLSSGSTGTPKCIQITNKNIVAYVQG